MMAMVLLLGSCIRLKKAKATEKLYFIKIGTMAFCVFKQPDRMRCALPFFLLCFYTFLFQETSAASIDTLPGKKKLSTIYYGNGDKIRGHICDVTDSFIIIVKRKNLNDQLVNYQQLIPAEQIKTIERKNNSGISTAASMGLGALVGGFIGLSIGLADCDDPNGDCNFADRLFETKDFRASLILSAVVGGAGLISGLFPNKKRRKKFKINGSRSNLQQNKFDLLYY